MRLKSNLKVREIGNSYMIVDLSKDSINLAHVLSLNSTAAEIWNNFNGRDFTSKDIADWLCNQYDVQREDAIADTEKLLQVWKEGDIIE